MEKFVELNEQLSLGEVFGVGDKNLRLLEKDLGVSILLKPEGFLVRGEKNKVEKAVISLEKVMKLREEGLQLTRQELGVYFSAQKEQSSDSDDGIDIFATGKRTVLAKTKGQREYIKAMNEHDVVFAIGPAGTGKTYLAMAMAVNYLKEKRVSRIILTRPAVEAGESLGFLPGDLHEKLGPYLRPLYDALYDMMEGDAIESYRESGVIEIAPLAYMRGRTLNKAFVILDEAQNCTSEQLKMFLTRLGFNSKAVITGDITQSDLPGGKPSGLHEAIRILKTIREIKFITLTKKDAVRHPLIQKIIQAYEDFDQQNTN